jgi:hypothetical protein
VSESKHTEGPWEIGGLQKILLLPDGEREEWWGIFQGKNLIALVKRMDDVRPIGAAPDLLEALKLFTSASMGESRPTRGESSIGWQKGDGLSASDRVAIARAAIAKATGAAS